MLTKIVDDGEYSYDKVVGYWYTKRFLGDRFHISMTFTLYYPWFTVTIVNRNKLPRRKRVKDLE